LYDKGTNDSPQSHILDNIKKHKTCNFGKSRYGHRGNVVLEECLDSFAKEEKIPEAYCSKCQEFRIQTKRMSLWRLPPIMIIHLKRFQFTKHMRRKLRDLVIFPLEGLDFSRIVASRNSNEGDIQMNSSKEEHGGEDNDAANERGFVQDDDSRLNDRTFNHINETYCSSCVDESKEKLYDLYAVVHHQGALSGGHYVASLKSEIDQKWRLFNDAQIYEINSKDVLDSSAYILFYIRRDVKQRKLDDFWDISSREGEGMTEEDVEKMMKQRERCVVS